MHGQQVVKVLQQAEWQRTDKVVDFFKSRWHGLTQTKLVEDAARELRAAETSQNFNKKMTGARAWNTLIKKGIDHTKHRFRPLAWKDRVIKRGLKDKTTSLLYKARPRLLPTDLHCENTLLLDGITSSMCPRRRYATLAPHQAGEQGGRGVEKLAELLGWCEGYAPSRA